jgi:hypothetical protein
MDEPQIEFRIRMLRCPAADEGLTDLFAEMIGNGLYYYNEEAETLTMIREGQASVLIAVTDKGLVVRQK